MQIQLPNGQIAEFPDDMPHEQIESVLQKQFPVNNQQSVQNTPNSLQDLGQRIGDRYKSFNAGAWEGTQGFMKNIQDAAKPFGAQKLMPLGAYGIKETEPTPNAIDNFLAQDMDKLYGHGKSKTLMDELLGIGGRIAGDPTSYLGVPPAIAAKRAIGPLTKFGGTRKLEKVKEYARDIPVNLEPTLLQEISKEIPSKEMKRLLQKVKEGKYADVFGLQSTLGEEAREASKFGSSYSDRRVKAPNLRDLQKQILDSIEKTLTAHGEEEALKVLRAGREDYRKYIRNKALFKKLGAATALQQATSNAYKYFAGGNI